LLNVSEELDPEEESLKLESNSWIPNEASSEMLRDPSEKEISSFCWRLKEKLDDSVKILLFV